MDNDSLDAVLALLKQLEAMLLGLKELRNYMGSDVGRHMLEVLIEESETKLGEVKRRLIQ